MYYLVSFRSLLHQKQLYIVELLAKSKGCIPKAAHRTSSALNTARAPLFPALRSAPKQCEQGRLTYAQRNLASQLLAPDLKHQAS